MAKKLTDSVFLKKKKFNAQYEFWYTSHIYLMGALYYSFLFLLGSSVCVECFLNIVSLSQWL